MDTNKFVNRHVGISAEDIPSMLQAIPPSASSRLTN